MPSIRNRRTLPRLEVLEDRTVPALLFGTGSSVVLSPTEAPDAWYPDRYAPEDFTSGQPGGGRDWVLDQFISDTDQNGSRPDPYNSGFYDFQGRKYLLDPGTTYLTADLYVPTSWSDLIQQDPNGNPASWGSLASLWATGVDASGSSNGAYPIIGFNNQAGSGTGGFRVFDQTNGWTDVAGFTGADRWYQIGFGIRAGQIDYFVNGERVYTDVTDTGTTALSTVMLEGYNGGNDYHIFWDNLGSHEAPSAADDAYTVNEDLEGQQPAEFNFDGNNGGWVSGWGDVELRTAGPGDILPEGSHYAVFTKVAGSAPFTRFDGYQYAFPAGGFTTTIQVYLDPAWTVGSGFDYSVAASRQNGSHLRDFIFHVAVQPDGKLLIGASNNTNNAPRMDLATINHYTVTEAGLYTLRHTFRDDGGVLAVDLELVDESGTVLWTETRTNAADSIADVVGGSRYGWFAALDVAGGVAVTGTRVERGPNPLSGRVLDNDTAPGGAAMTVELVDGPDNAESFRLNPNGTFVYVPGKNFTGVDTFTYRAIDAQGLKSNIATVSIAVYGVPSGTGVIDANRNGVAGLVGVAREQSTFTVPGTPTEAVRVRFRLLGRKASFRNQVGVFVVDDAQGRIAGLLPSHPQYLRRAVQMGRWGVIFRSGQRVGSTLDIPFNGGARLMFCVVPQGGLRNVLRANPRNRLGGGAVVLFADGRRNPDRMNHLRTSPLPNGVVLRWEDGIRGGDRDFNDVMFSAQLV